MERPPTAIDVTDAWDRFLRSKMEWDFGERPALKLPLNPPISVWDVVVPDGPTEPTAIRHCVVSIEYGTLHGRRAARLIGTVPGTEISVVLETRVDH